MAVEGTGKRAICRADEPCKVLIYLGMPALSTAPAQARTARIAVATGGQPPLPGLPPPDIMSGSPGVRATGSRVS